MSIRLTTGSRIAETSSKGNQEKWLADGKLLVQQVKQKH